MFQPGSLLSFKSHPHSGLDSNVVFCKNSVRLRLAIGQHIMVVRILGYAGNDAGEDNYWWECLTPDGSREISGAWLTDTFEVIK